MAKVLDSLTFPIKRNGATTNETFVNNPLSTASQFSTSTAYSVGQYVYYSKKLYRFTSAHAAGAWNASHVTEVTVASELADLKEDTTELKQDYNSLSESKADKTTNNPSMGSGYASQLVSSLRKSDSVPYNFRKVPYDSTLEDGSIVGASVGWNQLVTGARNSTTVYGLTLSKSADGHSLNVSGTASSSGNIGIVESSIVGVANHVYIASIGTPSTSGAMISFGNVGHVGDSARIYKPSSSGNIALNLNVVSGSAISMTVTPQASDLTQAFGTTIADYVYSLETATAGSGVAWLKEHFPKQFDSGYQAYNAGEIKSISGLSAHKSVGFNQWDEEYVLGTYDTEDGHFQSDTTHLASKNPIPVLPNTSYHFKTNGYNINVVCFDADMNYVWDFYNEHDVTKTIPANCRYIAFNMAAAYGTTYNHDICINISKSTGTPKNGDYVPYESHTYALDSTKTLRGILKLDSNNKLYADGDVYKADGTVERRYGFDNPLKNKGWNYQSTFNYWFIDSNYYNQMKATFAIPDVSKVASVIMSGYTTVKQNAIYNNPDAPDKSVCIGNNGVIFFKDTSITSTSYNGCKDVIDALPDFVYEKATPTTETAEPYGNPQVINPDGTESYVYTDGAFEPPVGHTSEYPVNVSGQLDDILDTPTTNGTYTLHATVTDGVVSYEWVSTT